MRSAGRFALLPSLACLLALTGCASVPLADEKQLLEAGREIRLRETGHTQAEVRAELDLFLNIELPALKEKAKRGEDKELTRYRWIWAIGGAGALAAATSGSLNDPKNRGTQYVVSGAGAAVALAGFALYSVRSGTLEECRAFLDRGGGDLAEWGQRALRPSDEPVAPEIWQAYVEKVHALRAHESCLSLRR